MEKWEIEYHQNCQELWEYENYCEQEFLSTCDQLNEELSEMNSCLFVDCLGV
jgi:hypothetical protein